MSLGGDIDYATTLDNAVDQFATGLESFDQSVGRPRA